MEAVQRLVVEATTPEKEQPKGQSRSKNPREGHAASENKNPNFYQPSPIPNPKKTSSPTVKSGKAQNSAPKTRIGERKFIVARKSSRKDGKGMKVVCSKCEEKFKGNVKKCFCLAYENHEAGQYPFVFNRGYLAF